MKLNSKFLLALVLIFAASSLRLVDDIPNFSPITALALFGGALFASSALGFGIPLIALFITDAVLGFHPDMPAVYACILLAGVLGRGMRSNWTMASAGLRAMLASLVFFGVTNFSVWMTSGIYARSAAGLAECFVAALPFFRGTFLGDLFFTFVLFGAAHLFKMRDVQIAAVEKL